jgi:hypothetical protein
MSGASALSAAKNRRSAGNIVQTTPNRNQVVQQGQQQQGQQQQGQRPQLKENVNTELPKPSNPIQALQLHEIRLNRYEKAQLELENSITTLATNLELTKKTIFQSQSQSQPIKSESQSNDDIHQMNERILLLEEMFHHLKEDIFRVQTFSMETSLSLLKIQNSATPTELAPVSAVPVSAAPAPVSAAPDEPSSNISLLINETTLSLSEIVDSSQ